MFLLKIKLFNMILANLCRSIKKSNFNNNIMYNSSSIYEY